MTIRHGPTALCLALLLLFASLGCGSWKRFAYEGFDRDSWQQPDAVIEALAIQPGSTVADIGAGGYFSFRLADAVGPNGRVYAVDIDEDMVAYLKKKAADDGYDNVTVVLGEFGDPLLPDGKVDLVFSANTYHHIQDRIRYFEGVRGDLAPGGRVAIIDLNAVSWFPRTFGHYTDKQVIVDELGAAGYRVDRDLDFVERQHFLIVSPAR